MQQTLSDPKSWKKWLFVLKRVKSSGTASLEYYKEVKKEAKQNPKGVLNLLSNYTVQIVGSVATRKFVFEVRTLEQTFRLAAETREMMDEWVYFMQGQTQVSHIVSSSELEVVNDRAVLVILFGGLISTIKGKCGGFFVYKTNKSLLVACTKEAAGGN
jgi:hypothetical protein